MKKYREVVVGMRDVRYRTETFSGTGERDAVEVMAFETFELGNTDILYHLEQGLLHDSGELGVCCLDFIEHLNNQGLIQDSEWVEFGFENGIAFYKEVLAEIQRMTGFEIKYALWLADKDVVIDKGYDGYGLDMDSEDDFDCYEVGPVVLSDLGSAGVLYGYTEMPVRLEDRVVDLEVELVGIINEREEYECEGLEMDHRRAVWLEERYAEVDGLIQEMEAILSQKVVKDGALEQQIENASSQKTVGMKESAVVMER